MWFVHPRPFNRKEVAVQMASAKAQVRPETRTITVDTPSMEPGALSSADGEAGSGAQGAASPAGPIRLSVSYTLRDYLGIVQEHIAYVVRQKLVRQKRRSDSRRAGPRIGLLWMMALALLIGAAHLAGLAWLVALVGATLLTCALVVALNAPFMLRPLIMIICTPVFFLKQRRMPVCTLTIDEQAIVRVSAADTLSIASAMCSLYATTRTAT